MRKYAAQPRPRAYEPFPIPWNFQDLPPGPMRQAAVFVVHGMGTQEYSDTAIELRAGFEDALSRIYGKNAEGTRGSGTSPSTPLGTSDGTSGDGQKPLPSPFIYEGYWADYDDIEKTFPEKWATFTPGEQGFFARLWKRRSQGTIRTAWWFIKQNFRLWRWKTIKEFGFATGLGLMGMAPLTVAAALGMSLASPRVLARVLSDVRVYCDPQGSVEEAIAQHIDRRVGERFLRLLGLDWDFNDLPADQLLIISGKPQVFEYVTWVSHSLGTIISYNVVSDILKRMEEQEQALEKRRQSGLETEEDSRRRKNLERVRTGLHRFYTLGSPLHPLSLLFPDLLRPWPNTLETKALLLRDRKTENWWVNFHYAADPISDRLIEKLRHRKLEFALASNRHTRNIWRIPGIAHSSYWTDNDILKYVISRAYGPELCKWTDPEFLGPKAYLWLRRLCLLIIFALLWLILVAVVLWFVVGGGISWAIGRLALWFKGSR